MGNFRSDNRKGGFSSGGRSGGFGGRSGGPGRSASRSIRGGFRDRDSGYERGRPQMHEVICDNCKKQCEVPFKPTGGKPVFCSDCFKKEDSGSRGNSRSNGSSSGISSEQFASLNKKLDKILEILESIEFEDDEEGDEDEDDADLEEAHASVSSEEQNPEKKK